MAEKVAVVATTAAAAAHKRPAGRGCRVWVLAALVSPGAEVRRLHSYLFSCAAEFFKLNVMGTFNL